MKLFPFAAMALFAAAPAFASSSFLVDFEKPWDYANGDVNDYYNGGTAADGTSGANVGVSFTNVSGLSNDASFTYYWNAPSPVGTAYAHTFLQTDKAFMNVAAGVDNVLYFFYTSPSTVLNAVQAYSGLNGTGSLLGTIDLPANNSGVSDVWTPVTLTFQGTALSFDFTNAANVVGLDNISAVPEPSALLMLLLGGVGLLRVGSRRRT